MRLNYYLLSAIFIVSVHLLMLVYDFYHPEAFLSVDRAGQRWYDFEALDSINNLHTFLKFLTENGNPGDYLPQWLIFRALGRLGLITVQVALVLWAGHAVFRLAQNLGLSELAAVVCGSIYLLTPHALVLSHQLSSEALYCPFLIVSLWLTTSSISSKDSHYAGLSGFLIGLANLIRPVTLLWPIWLALCLWMFRKPKQGSIYLFFAVLPVTVWLSFMAFNTGHFSMGESSRDLGHNLYQRIILIRDTMPSDEATEVAQRYLPDGIVPQGLIGTIPLSEYLSFVVHYPVPFIKHSLSEVFIFLSKSGVERFTVEYFPLKPGARDAVISGRGGWRAHFEKEGLVAGFKYLWETQGIGLIISGIGALVMTILSLLAFYGEITLIRLRSQLNDIQRFTGIMLMTLPLYIFLLSSAVDSMQSRHRAPAEAAIVIFAVYGFLTFLNRRTKNSDYWQ